MDYLTTVKQLVGFAPGETVRCPDFQGEIISIVFKKNEVFAVVTPDEKLTHHFYLRELKPI